MLAAFGLWLTKSAVTTESDIKYWLVDVKTKSGRRRVALTCINGQGQGMATAHTERSVADTKCQTAFLVGFWAGLSDNTGLGLNPDDVALAADRAPFRYENAIFASGDKLLADGSLNELSKKYHEKIRAVDKEAIGFALAC